MTHTLYPSPSDHAKMITDDAFFKMNVLLILL